MNYTDEIEHPFNDCCSDDSESDYEDKPTAALPIEITQVQTDLTGVPRNGHEYLLQVQHERKRFSKIAVASKSFLQDQTKFKKTEFKRQYVVETFLRTKIILSDEVQDYILKTFLDTKKMMETFTDKVQEDSQIFPEKISLSKVLEVCCTESPKVSQLVYLNQSELHNLLQGLGDTLERTLEFTCSILCSWVYSLMASLKEPLESDIYFTLRKLSRLLSQVREAVSPSDPVWVSCSLIILLIGKHFGQKDLLY